MVEKKTPLFGFGHKVYKNGDPRVKIILGLCKDLQYTSAYITTLLKIEDNYAQIKGRKLIINIDGLIGALLLSMGFDSSVGKGIFIIGRVSGLVAQVVEELNDEKPVRRLNEEEITYNPHSENQD